MNYLVLVNKTSLIKEDYYQGLELVETKDSLGNTIEIEKETYEAYLELKKHLENKGIIIALDSSYRSIDEQQRIIPALFIPRFL